MLSHTQLNLDNIKQALKKYLQTTAFITHNDYFSLIEQIANNLPNNYRPEFYNFIYFVIVMDMVNYGKTLAQALKNHDLAAWKDLLQGLAKLKEIYTEDHAALANATSPEHAFLFNKQFCYSFFLFDLQRIQSATKTKFLCTDLLHTLNKAHIAPYSFHALKFAARSGERDTINFYLQAHVNLNTQSANDRYSRLKINYQNELIALLPIIISSYHYANQDKEIYLELFKTIISHCQQFKIAIPFSTLFITAVEHQPLLFLQELVKCNDFFTSLRVCTVNSALTKNNRSECLKLMYANGMRINQQDPYYQETILHAAMQTTCSLEFVKELLILNADARLTNKDGNTALHCAIMSNHQQLSKIEFLLKLPNVAEFINIKNNCLQTALDLALMKNDQQLVTIISLAGGKASPDNSIIARAQQQITSFYNHPHKKYYAFAGTSFAMFGVACLLQSPETETLAKNLFELKF